MKSFRKNIVTTHRGWAGHLCVSDQCLFHLNTLVEDGDTKVVVSTVGDYRPISNGRKVEEIGSGRFYETMVFHALPADNQGLIDADVSRQVDAGDGYNTEMDANNGHFVVVSEIIEMMKSDTLRG